MLPVTAHFMLPRMKEEIGLPLLRAGQPPPNADSSTPKSRSTLMRTRSISTFVTLTFLSLLSVTIASAQSSTTNWTAESEMNVKNIAPVRVSPDGKHVAYAVSSAVMTPEKSEFVSQIWVSKTDGSGAMQLTFAEKSSADPQWSPDSKSLAFTSSRSGKSNLYVIRLDGGEAEQVTDVKSGINSYLWAPDGKRIAFVMRDAAGDDEEKNNKGKDDWR